MKHVFKGAIIEDMWFDTKEERRRYIDNCHDWCAYFFKSDGEKGFYLRVMKPYGQVPMYRVGPDGQIDLGRFG